MTPKQNEAMKLALEFIERVNKDGWILADFEPQMYATISAIKGALADHAMSKVQRFGQEIEQEPVAWLLTDKNINSLQVDSIQRLIDRAKHAHHTDLRVRINGQDEWYQADWLKHMLRAAPPQRTEQEPVAWMDADGNVSDNNDHKCFPIPLYTTQPQRKPLTNEEIFACENSVSDEIVTDRDWCIHFARAIEAKIKEST